jgi:outer membrane murein-binding lipoprotein Lpp
MATAGHQLEKEKAEATASKMQVGASVLGSILSGIFGRKLGMSTLTRGSSAIGKASSAFKQSRDVANVERKVSDLTAAIESLQAELQAGIEKISAAYDPAALSLETESLKPAKSDAKVQQVALLWLPVDARGERSW